MEIRAIQLRQLTLEPYRAIEPRFKSYSQSYSQKYVAWNRLAFHALSSYEK